MVAYLRQFLVVLLVLLQTAAPLVHAHVGGDAGGCGIHLHGLEGLQSDPDHSQLQSLRHDMQHQAAVVNVGSAIKLSLDRERFNPAPFLLPASAAPRLQSAVGRAYLPSRTSAPPTAPIPTDNASRAPPIY
ncbi:hypothetical protein [Methylomonas koyamae]|uniref:Uncharacterized protein n=1 Tax=Methylomonas koyamae TaxID=702114 RepID=A0A291IQA5_9GAMM|nr:hypothetical protein [Methylomonas koyamae]ATG92396.1 hypothetical protein MKLM6_4229 [Methylomonas koyamae]OAI26088.1 hypothetical protein A1356_12195 [Methylomonas koyamae]